MDDAQKTWFVTGCSSGFGRAIAEAALAAGDRVVATARKAESLAEWAGAYGGRVLPLALDVTDPARAEPAVREATEAFGPIDFLVNNAGRVHIGAVEEVTDQELKGLFDLHVFGPARLVRAVLPQMRARRSGTIVQISTMGSFFITPGFSSYTASKAAFEGLSATLAQELAPFGVRVLIVQPGAHRTPVFSAGQSSAAAEMPCYEDIVGPTRRFIASSDGLQPGDPERAARIIVEVARRDGELPLRLPLGGDAYDNITAALDAIGVNIREWEAVARSTAYGVPEVVPPS
ncbi:NAD(P)-dependent dehydrogenase (short-subunit alcohol dehydrogenase family) [Thermocatellispora tengchongensis]|uniref:NAD(P)-dependent dehydrogenase (Short-subunit alcohol dehydrogenase family) n=1 Tax=Thermocatellispora tengchongensis TaxID=1073253 RepID=A0A840PIV2_9ACTN|nr:SDR family NAD(P)-dependent oxidoreductase [Thermocatellispora tengchongensis]MBB5137843.1 NAD(P)-dependent dehydrogenase (short-subunit alcohol dehydrogenase family) [Thermocatellispora tengchongensis]